MARKTTKRKRNKTKRAYNRSFITGIIVALIVVLGAVSYANFGTIRSAFAAGTTYYVSPVGNDNNPGTLSAPFRTVDKAVGVATRGTTVYIRGGNYTEPTLNIVSGVTVRGYGSENPILTSRSQPMFALSNVSGTSLRDFTISGINGVGVKVQDSRAVTVFAVTFQNVTQEAILSKDTTRFNFSKNVITNTPKLVDGGKEYYGIECSGTAVGAQSSDFNIINNNRITGRPWGIEHTPFAISGSKPMYKVYVVGNTVEAGHHAILVKPGIYTKSIIVSQNRVTYDSGTQGQGGTSMGISIGLDSVVGQSASILDNSVSGGFYFGFNVTKLSSHSSDTVVMRGNAVGSSRTDMSEMYALRLWEIGSVNESVKIYSNKFYGYRGIYLEYDDSKQFDRLRDRLLIWNNSLYVYDASQPIVDDLGEVARWIARNIVVQL